MRGLEKTVKRRFRVITAQFECGGCGLVRRIAAPEWRPPPVRYGRKALPMLEPPQTNNV